MNECPSMIDKKWDPRWDSRPELLRMVGADVDPDVIDRVLDAMTVLVGTRDKVCFPGFGTWTRKPFHRKTPDGREHSVMRTYFNMADAAKRRLYGGRRLQKEKTNGRKAEKGIHRRRKTHGA